MTKRFRILPYKQGSASAKSLALAVGGKVLKLEGSKFKPRDDDVIINWGNTNPHQEVNPDLFAHSHTYYNEMDTVRNVSNKLKFFQMMKNEGVDCIPDFWINKEEIPNECYPVVCRTVLAGHSGSGIVIADSPADAPVASLYTKYIKKKDEYRVHLSRSGVIAVQRKAKRNGEEDVNWQIRTHGNGFNFIRDNVTPPVCVIDAATRSFEASSLDFGAVDVIYNQHAERAYVLEINTAPGLEGQTIEDYANFFKGYA